VPLHPAVRRLYLVLLAQFARGRARSEGFELEPTTNNRPMVDDLVAALSAVRPSAGQVVQFDLRVLSYDLELVPLDEILEFRVDRGAQQRDYVKALRGFMAQVALAEDAGEAERLYAERKAELLEWADRVRRSVRRAWKPHDVKAGFALGIAGAPGRLGRGIQRAHCLQQEGLARPTEA
jgi:hypothetical protein